MRARKPSLIIPAVIAAAVLTGCSTAQPEAPSTDAAAPRSGGTLRVAMSADYSCLDGQQARGGELGIAAQIIEGLTEQDAETGQLVPKLATEWEVNDDASEFTFTLRDDVVFHDGTAFTAESVKHNYETIAGLGARSSLGQTYFSGLESVDVIDEHTVSVAFESSNAQFLQATSTTTLGFYADETLAKSPEERCQGDVIGTGPFVFESYNGNQTVTLVRNEDYSWASELSAHEGPAYLDGIDFTVVPEASVRNGSLLSGQIDIDSSVSVQDRVAVEAQGFPVFTWANPGAPTNLWSNITRGVLADENVRYAISRALDREVLASVVHEDQNGATNAVSRSTPGYTSNEELLSYDPELAAELLDDAGWVLGSDGIREKDGQKLTVEITDYYKLPYLELVQEQLNAVGFDTAIKTVTFAERSSLLENGDYELMTGNLTRADPDILRTVYSIDQQNTNQRTERIPLDDAFDQTLSITDEDERQAALTGEISRELLESGYSIPMVETLAVVGTGKDVNGFRLDPSSRQLYYDVWLS